MRAASAVVKKASFAFLANDAQRSVFLFLPALPCSCADAANGVITANASAAIIVLMLIFLLFLVVL